MMYPPPLRVVGMLIMVEDAEGRPAWLSADPGQIEGATVTINTQTEYTEYKMYPWDVDPCRVYPTHQKISVEVDGLRGYTITQGPPGNWMNRPELSDPTVVEEDDDGSGREPLREVGR